MPTDLLDAQRYHFCRFKLAKDAEGLKFVENEPQEPGSVQVLSFPTEVKIEMMGLL